MYIVTYLNNLLFIDRIRMKQTTSIDIVGGGVVVKDIDVIDDYR